MTQHKPISSTLAFLGDDDQQNLLQSKPLTSLARYVFSVGRRSTITTFALMVFGGLTEGLSIVLLLPLLNVLDRTGAGAHPQAPDVTFMLPLVHISVAMGLGTVLVTFCILTSLRVVMLYFRDIFTADLLYRTVNTLRGDLFATVTQARWEFLAGRRGSELNHAMTADTDRVQIAVMQILTLAQSALLVAVYIVISMFMSAKMTLFSACIGVVALAVLRPIRRRARLYGETLTAQRQDQYQVVTEFLSSIKVAKSYNVEPFYVKLLRDNLIEVKNGVLAYMKLQGRGSAIFQILSVLGLSAFIYVAILYFKMPVAKIIVMLFLMMRIAPRIVGLQTSVQEVIANVAAFSTMRSLEIKSRLAVEQASDLPHPKPNFQSLEFDRVEFYYQADAERLILSQLSFSIQAGSNVAIVGPSGSGKSTVADLVMGLLEPRGGAILVDGTSLSLLDRQAWRQRIGYVPQDAVLLHDTILANVKLGRRDAAEASVWKAIEQAGAATFVAALPEGLNTIVGDRGVRLSGGERQRIALARALLRGPELLVLDEATSALDWESRVAVSSALTALNGSMTIINIAHRPSMVALADYVIAIRDGVILQAGPLADLAGAKGGYVHSMMSGEGDR